MGYKEVPDWLAQVLNAAGTPGGPWNFIQVSGVAVDAQGHVLVLHRGAHPILEFESNGKFVRSWGDGMSEQEMKKMLEQTGGQTAGAGQ
jgi:sugar (pentulose or hexulose) kinase